MTYSEFPLVEIVGANGRTDGRMDGRTAVLLEVLAYLKNAVNFWSFAKPRENTFQYKYPPKPRKKHLGNTF